MIEARVEDTLVLYEPSEDRYVSLNQAAEVVWGRLERPSHRRELAGALAVRFGLNSERALRDVESLVSRLLERGLLTISQ